VKDEAGGKILSQNSKTEFGNRTFLFFSFARSPVKNVTWACRRKEKREEPHTPPKIIGDTKDNIIIRVLEISIILGWVGEQKHLEGLRAFAFGSKKAQSIIFGRIGPDVYDNMIIRTSGTIY